MTEEWITVEVVLAHEMVDAVADFCHEYGSGVVLEDARSNLTRVTAYFRVGEWPDVSPRLDKYLAAVHEVFPDLPDPKATTSRLENENWAVTWKKRFKPIRLGKALIVTPPWIKPASRGRHVIIIDPAEAFGTGTHETTQGCLILLEKVVDELERNGREPTLLDVGCGSGILAIAGKKLGVRTVWGVDNDPVAIEAARRNAALNGVAGTVTLACMALEEVTGAWDIVTANLDPLTILGNRDHLVALFSRSLIVSGVPQDQWPHLKAQVTGPHLLLRDEVIGSEWASGLFVKRLQAGSSDLLL